MEFQEHKVPEQDKLNDGADPHHGFILDQDMQEQIRQASQDIREEALHHAGSEFGGHAKNQESPKHESAAALSPKHEETPALLTFGEPHEHNHGGDKDKPEATATPEPSKAHGSPKHMEHQPIDLKEEKPAAKEIRSEDGEKQAGESSPVAEKHEEPSAPPKPSPEPKAAEKVKEAERKEPEPVKLAEKAPEIAKEEEKTTPEKKSSPQEKGKPYGFLRSEELAQEGEKKAEHLYPQIPQEQAEQEKPKTRQSPQQKQQLEQASGSLFNPRSWLDATRLDPKVADLVYWRDVKKSGVALFSILAVLVSLSSLSLISVVAYVSLIALTGTTCFRIYKNVLQAMHKTEAGHPFKEYLDVDLTLSQEKVQEASTCLAEKLNNTVNQLRHVFLVEDLFDSLKFGVLLWALTYVGAWFNGLTLVILGVVGLFTLPKVYETYQEPIDQQLDMVRGHLGNITAKIQAVLPIGGKKEKAQ